MTESAQISRRGLLVGAAGLTGAAAVLGASAATAVQRSTTSSAPDSVTPVADASLSPFGQHQAGISTPLSAFGSFLAFTLADGASLDSVQRLLKLWTDDIVRLTSGSPTLADPIPELAQGPAALAIAVGFGAGLFQKLDLAQLRPAWLTPLPPSPHDELRDEWGEADLIVQITANDPMTVSHASNVLSTDAQTLATVRWVQRGFHRPVGAQASDTAGRNLMGQIDGIINPEPGSADFDQLVWCAPPASPAWLTGGTGMVIRRTHMDLATWGGLDAQVKDETIGRQMSDGSPLSGGDINTPVDLNATDDRGLTMVPSFSHVRLAMPETPQERILRRPYNYDDGIPGQAGLIFVAYAADMQAQYVPIQRRLDAADLLNTWITPIGSALFALLPGFQPGEQLGASFIAAAKAS